jgi:2-keto-4-pentenoate hydratase/2-oxohepta-3-ene-1,7-dioic acid hydratase in catechol pathway
MKLLRHGPAGQEKPGLMAPDGTIRDLSAHIADIGAEALSPDGIARLAAIDPATLPEVAAETRIGCPVANVGKFIAIGLNFSDHAAESNLPVPAEPVVFTKAVSCIQGPNDDVMIPKGSVKTDWEVELGIVIGSVVRNVPEEKALDHIAGYVLIHDVSEREFQIERGGTWDKGKGCDTFGPIGPFVLTSDEANEAKSLGMWLDVNGVRKQTGTTDTMIFNCAHIVSYLSRFMTLMPGDVITTGTPPGVGMGKKPQEFLKAGDVVELGIDKLGTQRQRVVSYESVYG